MRNRKLTCCGLGRASNEYHQDAFFELAREIREAKFHRQVASRLNQREKVRLNTLQSPKLLGRQLHRDTCRRRETSHRHTKIFVYLWSRVAI